MSESISPEKAFADLSTIKSTIDRTTGAQIFINFIYSTGTLLTIGGAIVLIACFVNYYLISSYGLTTEIKRAIIIMWLAIGILLVTYKTISVTLQGKKHGMGIITYYKLIVNKPFLQIDIPLELMASVYVIFFIKIGHPEYILPACVLWIAVLFTSLGAVFVEKSFTIVGYIYLACGTLGLLFLTDYLLPFVAVVFGVLSIIFGLAMHGRYKKLREEHLSEGVHSQHPNPHPHNQIDPDDKE